MPVVTSYPGVYIEELPSLSLSIVNGATAVPVFAAGSKNGDNSVPSITRIGSWLDFSQIFGDFDPAHPLHICMRTYFENGGGYCYICPVDDLLDEVPKLDDVTLLVAAGQDIRDTVPILCTAERMLFAILDGPNEPLFQAVPTDGDHGSIAHKKPVRDDNENVADDEPAGSGNGGIAALDPGDYDATPYAAVYYPWLTADWTAEAIPPSAAMAGVYCAVDRERGVWKAPANVTLNGRVSPLFKVSDEQQGQFNQGKAINMIRTFQGIGTVVWGARTLDDTDEWRYVNVRRLFSSAQKDIKRAMSRAVFEPNNHPTWERVRTAVDSYLHTLWRRGGLLGNRASDAYFVQVGKGITMTDDDIAQGRMIVKVGMAAVRPAEFIILQFTQDMT
jgi:phage tail sheath protein FI